MTTPGEPDPENRRPDDRREPLPDEPATHAVPPPGDLPPATPRNRFGRIRTVTAHRVTQLVAVLVLGLAIGAGVTALVIDGDDDRGGGRGEYSHHDDDGPESNRDD